MKKLVMGVPALVLLLSVTTVLTAPAFAASEQVVFSGTGSGTFGGTPTPVGFWIWCQATNPNPPYVGNCNGAMSFNALSTTKHVMEGSITEVGEGQYQIVVLSSDGTVNCTLENSPPPVSGPHNTVTVSCSAPSGSGASTSAVVNVTGP